MRTSLASKRLDWLDSDEAIKDGIDEEEEDDGGGDSVDESISCRSISITAPGKD